MPVVQVPGQGDVQFPDSMSDADIAAVIQKQSAPAAPTIPASEAQVRPEVAAVIQKTPGLKQAADFVEGIRHGASHVLNQAASYIPGLQQAAAAQDAALQPADTMSAKFGGFVGQTAPLVALSGGVGEALAGASLPIRAGAQALIGGGYSGVQSGFDPKATAIGAALGAGGETAGDVYQWLRNARGLPRVPTVENFRDAFSATPGQLPAIQQAMPTMAKYGITPQTGIHDMHEAIKSQLTDLGQQYQAAEAAGIAQKTMPAQDVIKELQKEADSYAHNGHVPSLDEPTVTKIKEQINDVKQMSQNGDISFAAVRRLRDAANGRTNFSSPDAEQNLYRAVGNVYRNAMDNIAPGTVELNRDYMNLSQLDQVAAKNISMGKGIVQSQFDKGLQRAATQPYVMSKVGRAIGEALPIPGAGMAFEALGAVAGPKITMPVYNALQNALQNGQLGQLPQTTKAALAMATRLGDNAAIMRILQGTTQQASTRVAQPGVAAAQ